VFIFLRSVCQTLVKFILLIESRHTLSIFTFCCLVAWRYNALNQTFSHVYLYVVTHNFQVKKKYSTNFRKFLKNTKLEYLGWMSVHLPWVNTWWKYLWEQLQLWVCWERSLPTSHTLIGKYLLILLHKTVQALSSCMGNIDGQQSSSHSTDFKLDLGRSSDWATRGHLSFCSLATQV